MSRPLGDDLLSDAMLAAWKAEGIKTDEVMCLPGRLPGLYMIERDARGERSFLYWRDRAPAREFFDRADDAALERLSRFDWLYLSGISLSLYGETGRARLTELLGASTMKTNKFSAAVMAASLLLSASVAFAQASTVKGEVKKIDEAAGKITLKHGPIKSLDMDEDGITMVFHVQDPAMLKQVKVGDKVQFEAERATAGITITKMQKGK